MRQRRGVGGSRNSFETQPYSAEDRGHIASPSVSADMPGGPAAGRRRGREAASDALPLSRRVRRRQFLDRIAALSPPSSPFTLPTHVPRFESDYVLWCTQPLLCKNVGHRFSAQLLMLAFSRETSARVSVSQPHTPPIFSLSRSNY